MRIAVLAAGGVGAYFGARLAAAGHDVHFIARGAHLSAMRRDGLRILSIHGDLHLPHPNVTDDPAAVGPADIVLFAVKLWDVEAAAEFARPLLGESTRLITLQNGVDSYERVAPLVSAEHAAAGVASVASVIAEPGVIQQTSSFHAITFGRPDGRADDVLERFAATSAKANCIVKFSTDIQRDRWRKFVVLTGTSGATALTRMTLGDILADADTRAFLRGLMQETFAVGRAEGVALEDGYVDERMAYTDANVPRDMRTSMAHDVLRGNRLEVEWLNGHVSRLGRAHGIATPRNDTVYAGLKLLRMGAAR
ncbi:MAG TPA: ketopantoate reductase family protein [Pseudolabrys sp.]|nr:ketopantoate reductase family protein [Pseudolabrys sp.]